MGYPVFFVEISPYVLKILKKIYILRNNKIVHTKVEVSIF